MTQNGANLATSWLHLQNIINVHIHYCMFYNVYLGDVCYEHSKLCDRGHLLDVLPVKKIPPGTLKTTFLRIQFTRGVVCRPTHSFRLKPFISGDPQFTP